MTKASSTLDSNYGSEIFSLAQLNVANTKGWKRVWDLTIVLLIYLYNLPIALNTYGNNVPSPLVLAIFAAICLPFFWRKRFPRAAFFTTAVFVTVQLALGIGPAVVDIMLVVALCSLTMRSKWPTTVTPLFITITLVLIATYEALEVGYLSIGEIGFVVVAILLAYSWATVVRIYSQYIEVLQKRAIEARKIQKDREHIVMIEERKRIARELHDVVSHGLSSIIALSDGALATYESNPEQARRAVEQINSAGRSALEEMRTMLTLLRSDYLDALSPQPSFADIDHLIDSVRSTGVDIRVHYDGDFSGLNPRLQLALYRIMQESLTNVYKHAGSECAVRVHMHKTPTQLKLVVRNTLPQLPQNMALPASGLGIQGMRERVHEFGGEIQADITEDGNFEVSILVPLEDAQ